MYASVSNVLPNDLGTSFQILPFPFAFILGRFVLLLWRANVFLETLKELFPATRFTGLETEQTVSN
jgi:hypothetical protein